jgi:hypothetical protein
MSTLTPNSHILLRRLFAGSAIALTVAGLFWQYRHDKSSISTLPGSVSVALEDGFTLEQDQDGHISLGGFSLRQENGQYEQKRRIESGTLATESTYNGLGVRWHADVPDTTGISIQVRIGHNDVWTSWRPVLQSEDAAVANDQSARVSDVLFVPNANQLQVAVELSTENPSLTPRLDDIRFDFIDSKEGPSAVAASLSAQSQSAQTATVGQPTVISRAAWGADESYMTWAPQGATIQQFILHHSAGSDGGNDPAAVIRGIYYYHAVTLGWGDIGYNYVVDPQGRIYQGRSGPEGTIAAHTYGYNTGSVGIALLGNYDSITVTPAAEQAVANLVGYLSAKNDLDPQAVKNFINVSAPTLAGHRDFGQTLCPGTAQYGRMPTLRSSASAQVGGWLSGGQYQGVLQSVSGNVLEKNQPGTATVSVRNTGQQTWVNSGSNPAVLSTFDPVAHASPLFTTGWISASEVSRMTEPSVAPGQTATFSVPLAAAALGDLSDTFAVIRTGIGPINGTVVVLNRSSREKLAGQVVPIPDPLLVEGGSRLDIEVRVKNTGAATWTNTGINLAALNLTQPKGRTSIFQDASWPLAYRPTIMDTESVPPDSEALFRFTLKVPAKPGEYREAMWPVIDRVGFVPGTEFVLHLVVTNPYQSELLDRPIVLYATPGQQLFVPVQLKNRSSLAWQPSGAGFVALEAVPESTNGSLFKSTSWLTPIRALSIPNVVESGKSTSLSLPLTAPTQVGEYQERYHLVSDGQANIDGSSFTIRVSVRPGYRAQVTQAPQAVTLAPNTTGRVQLTIANTGSATWQSTGDARVVARTINPTGHGSNLAAPSWSDLSTPTQLEPPVVAPDQVATLSIEVSAGTTNGSASDTFALFDPQGNHIAGSDFTVQRTTQGEGAVAGPSGPQGPTMRVGIYSNASSISVSSTSAYTVRDSAGTTLGTAQSGAVTVAWNGSGYAVTGAVTGSSAQSIRIEPTADGILELTNYEDHPSWNPSLNDNTFRGSMEVRRSSADNQVYAINHIPLELYLRGLAEASNGDDATYLQTLLTVARTYAEYNRQLGGKHPEHGFDVDNKNDQVYKGYGFEQRAPDISAAVDATKGSMILYNGQVVVTPYFSQSDGRTRSFDEVWGGPAKPWLVSVQVPENAGKPLLGHGVGLDASAARYRALAGHTRDAILKYFYTGISIEKLY